MWNVSTYTISFDEFLELFQESLPEASIASFVATIFIAVALGAFGTVLTYAIDPGSKLVASTFCWISLVLFLAAFWDLTLRTRKRRARAVRELRIVYEQYYSGERTFTFDVEKWAIQGSSGRQESVWTSLLTAAEKQNVILLSSQNQIS